MTILTGGAIGGVNLRGAIAQALEPETVTYFAAMDAASESYWPSEKALIDNFIKALKNTTPLPLWDRPRLLWMPVGASLSGAMRALKHPLGVGTVMTNNGFTADRWDRRAGLDGRGVSHYIGTGTTEFNYTPSNDTHLAVSVESEITGAYRDMGNGGSDSFQLIVSFGGDSYYRAFDPVTGIEAMQGVLSTDRGVVMGVRSGTVSSLFKGSQKLGSQTRNADSTPPKAGEIRIFSTFDNSSNKILSMASAGKSFLDNEAIQYSSIIQAARTARAALSPP
jgi:hypothetical protein